jgi:hypothetical protein
MLRRQDRMTLMPPTPRFSGAKAPLKRAIYHGYMFGKTYVALAEFYRVSRGFIWLVIKEGTRATHDGAVAPPLRRPLVEPPPILRTRRPLLPPPGRPPLPLGLI